MNIFYPKNHYNKKFRGHVFPLLKPFFKNAYYRNLVNDRVSEGATGINNNINDVFSSGQKSCG